MCANGSRRGEGVGDSRIAVGDRDTEGASETVWTIKVLRAGYFCADEWLQMAVARPPRDWDVDDARAFLHRLQLESVTPERPLLYIDRIRIHDTRRPNVIALEVASNSGVMLTEPIRVSAAAMDWLEKTQFESRPE